MDTGSDLPPSCVTDRHAEPCRRARSARGAPRAAGGRRRRRLARPRVRWAHVIEMPDPDDLLKGGELVLTTGLGASAPRSRRPGPRRWSSRDGRAGGRARSTWRDVPTAVVAGVRARRRARGRLPPPVRFIEITEAVHGAVVNAQFALLRARGGDPPALHRADPAGPRRARDPGGAVRGRREPGRARGRRRSLVYYVSRPAGRRPRAAALGGRAPRRGRAARSPRACSPSTCGCSTRPGGG